jgi:hypothetical protein
MAGNSADRTRRIVVQQHCKTNAVTNPKALMDPAEIELPIPRQEEVGAG